MNWNDYADDAPDTTALNLSLALTIGAVIIAPWLYGVAHAVAWIVGALPW